MGDRQSLLAESLQHDYGMKSPEDACCGRLGQPLWCKEVPCVTCLDRHQVASHTKGGDLGHQDHLQVQHACRLSSLQLSVLSAVFEAECRTCCCLLPFLLAVTTSLKACLFPARCAAKHEHGEAAWKEHSKVQA